MARRVVLRYRMMSEPGASPSHATPTGALARAAARRLFARLRGGCLEVREGGSSSAFGDPRADLRAAIDVRRPRAWSGLLRGGLGVGDGYARGDWDADDLVALIRIGARNMGPLDALRRRVNPLAGPLRRLGSRLPVNSRSGARRNVAAHYDLGNELFASFLDSRLVYSCAYFPRPGVDLDDAQLAKLERICQRLELCPDDHLLEIGTGWGALALHAAGEHGCRVTTTTISREQQAHTTARVRELGLAGRITVLGRDYRDLEGRYSKLVSVEMIEAVGWQYFPAFFAKCSQLLEDDGLMLLQAIVIADELYEVEKASRTFANTRIFPGGCLPSERLIGHLVRTRTDMRPTWADDITPHYAETLRHWRERFAAAAASLARLGYDERFRRLWTFYLAASEAGFRERRIRDLQLLFAKAGVAGARPAPVALGRAGAGVSARGDACA